MASNKKKPAGQKPEDEVIDGQEQANDEGVAPEESATPDEAATAEAPEPEEPQAATPDEDHAIPVFAAPFNLHQRLEALELTMLGKPAEKAWPINRVTILTGTLKTALPDVIRHIEDESLRDGLKTLLEML